MKKLVLLFSVLVCIAQTSSAQLSLTLLNSYTLTPNATDTLGAFARIYYHPSRNKFYMVYAARPAGSILPAGMLTNFAWREYSSNMIFTGNKGSLPGFTSAGDFAMVMVDSNYYHLTNLGSTSSGILKYKLTKFDDDFNSLSSISITLNSHDSNIDQLMNYTNGRLIIGAMHDSSATPPVTPPSPYYNPNIHLFQYDLNLSSIASDIILDPKAYSWGASCIYNAGNYYIITTNSIATHKLYCYKYDVNFNYLSNTQISADGQWAQGAVWDGQYYYVAYHTGDHKYGNVSIGVYDANWVNILTDTVTSYPVITTPNGVSYNAHRPFITRVGNKLYVSYDVSKYLYPMEQKDWQAHVKVYQIDNTTGINEFPHNHHIGIFPNPSSGVFTITEKGELSIYNSKGENIYREIINSEKTEIDLSKQPKGIYIVSLKQNSKTIKTGKLIISTDEKK